MNKRKIKKQINRIQKDIISFNKNIGKNKDPMYQYALREEKERIIGLTRSYQQNINVSEILSLTRKEQQEKINELRKVGKLNKKDLINKYTIINRSIYEKSEKYIGGVVDFNTFNKFLIMGGKDMIKEKNTNAFSETVLLYLRQYIENGNSLNNGIERFKRYVRNQEIIIEKSKARTSMIFSNL